MRRTGPVGNFFCFCTGQRTFLRWLFWFPSSLVLHTSCAGRETYGQAARNGSSAHSRPPPRCHCPLHRLHRPPRCTARCHRPLHHLHHPPRCTAIAALSAGSSAAACGCGLIAHHCTHEQGRRHAPCPHRCHGQVAGPARDSRRQASTRQLRAAGRHATAPAYITALLRAGCSADVATKAARSCSCLLQQCAVVHSLDTVRPADGFGAGKPDQHGRGTTRTRSGAREAPMAHVSGTTASSRVHAESGDLVHCMLRLHTSHV